MLVSTRCLLFVVLCGLMSAQSGCITLAALMGQKKSPTLDTSLLEAQGYSIPPGGMPSPVAPDVSRGPRVVLEVRDDGRHLESIPLPSDKALFVEELVQQAQLHERFGELSISIMRPTGTGGPPIRLETATDENGKAVNIGHNYALLPGDHLVVISDDRSGFERMIDKHFKKK